MLNSVPALMAGMGPKRTSRRSVSLTFWSCYLAAGDLVEAAASTSSSSLERRTLAAKQL